MSQLNVMPDDTRLWIFQAERTLSNAEKEKVEQSMAQILEGWNAHGRKLTAASEIRYQRFLIVAVDESRATASGCSIDQLFNSIRSIGEELSVDFFDRTQLAYRIKGEPEIHTVPLSEFADKVGSLGKDNLTVFNNLIDKHKELEKHWETGIDDSWHAQLL